MPKNRLDKELVLRRLAESREQAASFVMAGEVSVNGAKQDKSGFQVNPTDVIELSIRSPKYVSRGGLKLEKALESFHMELNGKVCIDVGSSTGGFTDCLLKFGASRVYSIDVGYGQLALKLRNDERVIPFERENFRYLAFDKIGEACDMATMDVSFISSAKLAGNLKNFLKPDAEAVILIKPQFESERKGVGKNGVVKDPAKHYESILRVVNAFSEEGFAFNGIDFSPITGPKGNIEFLALFGTGQYYKPLCEQQGAISNCVDKSHEALL